MWSWAHDAARVPLQSLDHHHVGTLIGENLGRERPHHDAGQIQDADALQRTAPAVGWITGRKRGKRHGQSVFFYEFISNHRAGTDALPRQLRSFRVCWIRPGAEMRPMTPEVQFS